MGDTPKNGRIKKMFNTYEEARDYAKARSRKESGYVGIVMTKGDKFNVAKNYDEVDYAESLGWEIVK